MPTEKYEIRYVVDSDDAVARIAKLEVAVRSLDKAIEQTRANAAAFLKDTSFIVAWTSAVEKAGKAAESLAPKADKAAKATSAIGANSANAAALEQIIERLGIAMGIAVDQAKAMKAAMEGVKAPKGMDPNAGGGGGGGIGGLAAKAVAVNVARKLMQTSANAFSDAEKKQLENVAKAEDFRAEVQKQAEVAGTKVDTGLLEENLKLAEKTGMSPTEAAQFSEIYRGAIGSGVTKHQTTGGKQGISKKTAMDLMPMAALFAKRTGIEPDVAGKMIGSMGEFTAIRSPEEGMAMFGQIEGHLNLGGLGTIRQLSRPFQGLLGTMIDEDKGRVSDPVRLAAMFAAETNRAKSPAIAATEIKQANRGIMKLQASGSMGLTPEMDYTEAIKIVAGSMNHLNGTQKDQVLQTLGLGNSTERDSLIKQAALVPTIEQALQDPAVKQLGANALGLNAEFLKSQTGRTAVSKSRVEASEIRQGMKGESYTAALAEARARLTDRGEIDTTGSNLMYGMMDFVNPHSWITGRTMKSEMVDAEVRQGLAGRRKAAGLDPYAGTAALESPDFQTRSQAYEAAIKQVEAAEKLQQAANAMNQALNPGRPPGNAAVVPMRP